MNKLLINRNRSATPIANLVGGVYTLTVVADKQAVAMQRIVIIR